MGRAFFLEHRLSHRTRKPTSEDQAYVRSLVESVGICRAAQALKLSRLATLNVSLGGDCYASTLAHVTQCRLGAAVRA
jgi:hypothetical protein